MLVLQILGVLFLGHSAYSAREYVQVAKGQGAHALGVPGDIQIEALVGVVLIILGAIWGAANDFKPLKLADENADLVAKGEIPFARLETRPSFQDLIARRGHWTTWKQGGSSGAAAGESKIEPVGDESSTVHAVNTKTKPKKKV